MDGLTRPTTKTEGTITEEQDSRSANLRHNAGADMNAIVRAMRARRFRLDGGVPLNPPLDVSLGAQAVTPAGRPRRRPPSGPRARRGAIARRLEQSPRTLCRFLPDEKRDWPQASASLHAMSTALPPLHEAPPPGRTRSSRTDRSHPMATIVASCRHCAGGSGGPCWRTPARSHRVLAVPGAFSPAICQCLPSRGRKG
jgi:hypothetical protein